MAIEERVTYKSRFEVTKLACECVLMEDDVPVSVAGRVIRLRDFGSLIFGHLLDRSGTVQFSLRKNTIPEPDFEALKHEIQIGDFIGVNGAMWTTKKGERTVGAVTVDILSKAVKSLPDKWLGVANAEVKQRKRYLDLIANESTRKRFLMRSRVISFIRHYLDDHGFVEVEVPILQPQASGASAKPFVTRHEALGRDLYLRISPETYLKRLVAGSFERVYEIGKNFRNEGLDSSHLQEFTMLEWYAAYWDYQDNINFCHQLLVDVIMEFKGSLQFEYQGQQLDFGGTWTKHDFRSLILDRTGVDLNQSNDLSSLRSSMQELGFEIDTANVVSYASLVDLLYKKVIRPSLIQPTFLMNHPIALVPLARTNDDDPRVLDMFQVLVNSWEIVKAYSELIDPLEQRRRLMEQVALRSTGDEEAMMLEEDFIECMEYGMPPMSGLGLGIDRLVAILTDSPTLRDVVLFPSVRDK